MSEVINHLQHWYSDGKSDELFDNMKAKIEQLQEDVGVVMKGRSQKIQMSAAIVSLEMVKEHDELYQQ